MPEELVGRVFHVGDAPITEYREGRPTIIIPAFIGTSSGSIIFPGSPHIQLRDDIRVHLSSEQDKDCQRNGFRIIVSGLEKLEANAHYQTVLARYGALPSSGM